MSESSQQGGVGFVGLLTILFVALKLIPSGDHHIIDWSWWWVLSPAWISAIIVVLVLLGMLIWVLVEEMRK